MYNVFCIYLRCKDEAGLLAAGNTTLGGVGTQLVGGPTLVLPRVLAVAVQDVLRGAGATLKAAECKFSNSQGYMYNVKISSQSASLLTCLIFTHSVFTLFLQ